MKWQGRRTGWLNHWCSASHFLEPFNLLSNYQAYSLQLFKIYLLHWNMKFPARVVYTVYISKMSQGKSLELKKWKSVIGWSTNSIKTALTAYSLSSSKSTQSQHELAQLSNLIIEHLCQWKCWEIFMSSVIGFLKVQLRVPFTEQNHWTAKWGQRCHHFWFV